MRTFILRNANGCSAKISDYGGIVLSLTAPDREGEMGDVLLGFDEIEQYADPSYIANCPYFGALIGRYGNRIVGGRFTLGGKSHQVSVNNGPNHLHGGSEGFDKKVWDARPFTSAQGDALELRYISADGEEGYPGSLTVKSTYTLSEANELSLRFEATADQLTIINLTHHLYFNLRGGGDVLSHELMIDADQFTPINADSIPEGALRDVKGTPFDFRQPTAIGSRIHEPDEQISRANGGYDHNFALERYKPRSAPRLIARVTEPESGRVLEVSSTEPGVQFYTGNFLDGSLIGKGGAVYAKHSGFCLEPQHFPNSPNRPDFPSTELKPGETYVNKIIYRLGLL